MQEVDGQGDDIEIGGMETVEVDENFRSFFGVSMEAVVISFAGEKACWMEVVIVFIVEVNCSMVLAGRLGTLSGRGLVGALPYLKEVSPSVGVSSLLSCPLFAYPEPVDPTRVTELRFEGDGGPLRLGLSKEV